MFSSFSPRSWIVNHCTSSREDLPAAPPGSPPALPLIYSLIHLCCCHMASLSLPPPHLRYSLHHPPLPPSLPLLISQSCSSRGPLNQGMPLHSPLPSTFPFPLFLPPRLSLFFFSACLRALLQQGPPASFACAAVHSQGQRRSDLATVSD